MKVIEGAFALDSINILWKKSREIMLYLLFGAGTTIVNIAVYYISTQFLHLGTVPGNCLAWIVSVLFAYITNRTWVFQSRISSLNKAVQELVSFVSGRIATGVLDVCLMYVSVDVLRWNNMLMKVFINVIVIVLNYAVSKLWVFRVRDKCEKERNQDKGL